MTTGTLSQFHDYEGSLTATAHAMKTSFLSPGSVCQQVYQKIVSDTETNFQKFELGTICSCFLR